MDSILVDVLTVSVVVGEIVSVVTGFVAVIVFVDIIVVSGEVIDDSVFVSVIVG